MYDYLSRVTAALICAAVLAPTSPATVAAQSPTSRDSAGVRLTSIVLRGPTGRVRMSTKPAVDIGESNGDSLYELNHVRGVVRLHDGTIVVANGNPAQLRFFDSHGKLARLAGRTGNGPGEFKSIGRLMALRGDTVVVFDGITERIVLFTSTGAVAGTHGIEAPRTGGRPTILGAFANQQLLAATPDIEKPAPRPAAYYFGQHAFAYGLDGRPAQEIGPFGDGEHFVQQTAPELGVAYWDLAFGRMTTIVPRGNDVLVGDGSTFELRSYTRTGAVTEIIRAPMVAERLTDAERNAYRESELKDVSAKERPVVVKMLDEMPYPKTIPTFKRFFVADDGRIWVQRYGHVGDDREKWIVLDARGQFLDELTMPARFRLWAAGAAYLLGVYRDGDDVEHVQQYALVNQ